MTAGTRLAAGPLCALAMVAMVAMLGAPASAQRGATGALVNAPATWRTDPELATALAQRFAATRHLGGLEVSSAAEAYVADPPGVALFATRATARLPDAARAGPAARAALDELRASPRRASLSGATPTDEAWQERVEEAARQVVATLSWRDPASRTFATARLVVASDGARLAAVTGECLASEAADPVMVSACRTALTTLDPGIPAAQRIAVAPAAPGTGATAGTSAEPDEGAGAPRRPPPPRLDSAAGVVFPPTVIPQPPREPDRRPVYVGAVLIALALTFWWNRRRRDRFDREERSAPGGAGDDDELRGGAAPHDDEDADDLHAAARGERADRPDDREDDRPRT